MRSAEQIGRTVSQWHDYQRDLRRKRLREVLSILARSHDEPWYRWVLENAAQRREDAQARKGSGASAC